ncbi:MAG: Lrp/AsnC ligand binding domain-containing protein [Candidatus Thermoplasmatota archaeon]|nr:Lrp/AsnC ligand binding domain-containing protein [Candidatus Thermoplasmatota archaeon]
MVVAYLIALVDTGKEHEAAKEVSAIKGVEEVLITYGRWDLIVKVNADTLNELDVIITKVRSVPEIEMTETLVGM